MNPRILRAIGWITLYIAAMSVAAYGFGRVTDTDWVPWLAPLIVALEGSLPFRGSARGGAAPLSLSELPRFSGVSTSVYVVSFGVAAGATALGAYTGNRVTLIAGAALAILGSVLEPEESAFEHSDEPA